MEKLVRSSFILTALFTWLVLPGFCYGDDDAKLKEELQAVNAKFIEHLVKHDAKALGSLYLDDAVLQFQGAPTVEGRSNIEAYWMGVIKEGVLASEVTSDRVIRLAHDTVAQIGTYKITLAPSGSTASTVVNGKYAAVYVRRQGQWKVIIDTGSE